MDNNLNPNSNNIPESNQGTVAEVVGELAFQVGKLIATFYAEYCEKVKIAPPHVVTNVNVFKANEELYRFPLICLNLGEILRYSETREYWAALLWSYISNFRKEGFNNYDSVKNTLSIFVLKWDDPTKFPTIELNAELLNEDSAFFKDPNDPEEQFEVIEDDEDNDDDPDNA